MDIEFNNILLAIDNGATAGIAQQQALDLAQKFKASITVLLIGDDHTAFSDTIKFLGDFTLGKKTDYTVGDRYCRSVDWFNLN